MKFLILCIFCVQLTFTQSGEYLSAINDYNAKRFEQAEEKFQKLTTGSLSSEAHVMLMMTQYAMQRYQAVKRSYSNFMRINPSAEYLDDAHYIYGKALFQQKETKKAVEFWLLALNETNDDALTTKCHKLISEALEKVSSVEDISDYIKTVAGERAQAVLAVKAAEKEERAERYLNARAYLNDFIRNYPSSSYVSVAKKRVEKLNSKISNHVYIGVLLPFEAEPELSNALFNGYEYAVKEMKKSLGIDISLKKEESGVTVLSAIQAAQRLTDDRSIIAMVGPLYSDQSAAVALLASQSRIPTITPTATLHGLVDLSDFFYQLSTDNQTFGKLVAEYAFGILNQRSFAILSAESGKSYEMAQGFAETIERLGGEIVSNQVYFAENVQNLGGQFEEIHRAGIKKVFRDSIEFADPTVETFTIDTMYQSRLEKEAKRMVNTGVEVDSAKINVSSIDAIFMPISLRDNERIVDFIARYYATNNFTTHVLGSEDWHAPEIFANRSLARAFDSLFVFKPFHIEDNASQTRTFINGYRVDQKKTPTRYDYLGYRTMRFILSGLDKANNSRESVQRRLSNENDLMLIGGQIDFNHKERVNSGAKVLQLLRGKFEDISYK